MRERAITFLPMAKLRKNFVLFDPFCAADFHGLDQIRQRNRRVNRSQNVNMVFNAVQPEQMAIMVFYDAPDVTKQILAARFIQNTFAIFRRKNDVINDLRVGGQNVFRVLFDPFRVVIILLSQTAGCTCGYPCFIPTE